MKSKIKVDNRLKDIASLIPKCNTVADIGTDHGYLAIYLIQENIAQKVIASDVAVGPLSQAKANIKKYNLDDKITTILSDGLDKIDGLADCIVMAGMGANLIISILEKRKVDYPCFILEANLNTNLIRKYVSSNNYQIVDEKVSFVAKKYYEIIKIEKGHQELSELEIKYGPINLKKMEPNFINKLNNSLTTYENILVDFKGNDLEKARINKEIDEIKNILKERRC